MSLTIELTPSEQWAAKQVGDALSGAKGGIQEAEKALESAHGMARAAEEYASGFVASVLAAHKKQDPGTIPAITQSKIGMRLTWTDPPPAPRPTVVTPALPKGGKVIKLPDDASPAKKAAAGKRGKKKTKKKTGGRRG